MITHIASKLGLLLLVLFLSITVASQASAQKPELVVQAGHRAMIKVFALSSDNRLLASAGAVLQELPPTIILTKFIHYNLQESSS